MSLFGGRAPTIILLILIFGLSHASANEAADVLLDKAIVQNNQEMALSALALGANPNLLRDQFAGTALCKAIKLAGPEIVRSLLERGAGANAPCQDPENNSPLTSAIGRNNTGIIELLISAGADRTNSNSLGERPMDIALASANTTLARMVEPDAELSVLGGAVSCFGSREEHAFQRAPALVITAGHGDGRVRDVDFSPDGKLMVSAGTDGSVRLWRTIDGALIKSWQSLVGGVRQVFIDPAHQSVVWIDEFGGATAKDYVNDTNLIRISPDGGDEVLSSWRYSPESFSLVRIKREYSADGPSEITIYRIGQCGKTVKLTTKSAVFDVLVLENAAIFADESVGKLKMVTLESLEVIASGNIPKGWRVHRIESRNKSGTFFLGMHEKSETGMMEFGRRKIIVVDAQLSTKIDEYELSKGSWIEQMSIEPDGNRVIVSDGYFTEILETDTHSPPTDLGFGDLDIVEFAPNDKCVLIAAERGQAGLVDLDRMEFCRRFKWDVAGIRNLYLDAEEKFLIVENDGLDFWDLELGRRFRRVTHEKFQITDSARSPDGRKVATSGNDGTIRIYDISTGHEIDRIPSISECGVASIDFGIAENELFVSGSTGFSDNGEARRNCDLAIWRLERQAQGKWRKELLGRPDSDSGKNSGFNDLVNLRSAENGAVVYASTEGGADYVWRRGAGIKKSAVERLPQYFSSQTISLHPSIENLAIIARDRPIRGSLGSDSFHPTSYFANPGSSEVVTRITRTESGSNAVGFSKDGILAYVGTNSGKLIIADVATKKPVKEIMIGSAVTSVALLVDSSRAFVGTSDGTVLLVSLEDGRILGNLTSLADKMSSWVFADVEGRFDSNNLERLAQLNWRMPGENLELAPIEIFTREFFEPNLLGKVLRGEDLRHVPELAGVDRRQPALTIKDVVLSSGSSTAVDVLVETAGDVPIRDIHVFVDDRLALRVPELGEQFVRSAGGVLTGWVRGIPAPTTNAIPKVRITAFGFSNAGIKSATVDFEFENAAFSRNQSKAKSRAFVVSIGIDNYNEPSLALDFAAADADAISSSVMTALQKTQRFSASSIIPLKLTSDKALQTRVTKQEIIDLLVRLGGSGGAPDNLAPTPDDTVIFAYSGHGVAGANGEFYLFASDSLLESGQSTDERQYDGAISSSELTELFSEIQAGSIVVIVDACNAAASVEAGGAFRAGPMGSRGFGQLAYNKKMSVLAGSQAEGVAIESEYTRNGLLTYALTTEALDQSLADYRPSDGIIGLAEWLQYGEMRVPSIAQDPKKLSKGRKYIRKPKPAELPDDFAEKYYDVQRPLLFDFSGNNGDAILSVTGAKVSN